MKLFKFQNSKLKDQYIFNILVDKSVCGRTCPGCYALKAQKRFPKTVVPYRQARLDISKTDEFVELVVSELKSYRRPCHTVRIHESGEFHSQAYVDKWSTIARLLPNFIFYTFTKRLRDFNFSSLMSMPNVIIIDSLMHGSLNYDKVENLDPSIFTCPVTAGSNVECGTSCRYCMTKLAQYNGINFVKH